jgi:glycoside/pentoside/hexuronide:cation symporter, GPH family
MTDRGAAAPALVQPEGKALSLWQKVSYSFGNVGTNLAPGLLAGWFTFYYIGRPVSEGSDETIMLVPAGILSALIMMGKLVDAVSNPIVGYLSDKWTTRWGRRTPWVVVGSPIMAFFLAMIWFPPDDHATTANVIWLAIALAGVWFAYTAVVAPYLSLLPEITPYQNERVVVSTYMSYADVVGMILMSVAIGAIFEAFHGGLTIGPLRLSNGYQVGGLLTCLFMMACFILSVVWVRENPQGTIQSVRFGFMEAARECLRNPSFWPYIQCVTLLRLGVDVLINMIPFMVIRLMGYGEGAAGALQAVIILVAALFLPLTAHLANVYGKKKVFSYSLIAFAVTVPLLMLAQHAPFLGSAVAGVVSLFGIEMTRQAVMFTHCVVLFLALFLPVSAVILLPRPIYADIMDHDEERTGYRREAMYNGMEGLLTKVAAGIAQASVPLMVAYLGGSADRPWGILAAGPICGLALFFGWVAFRRHPFDK